MASCAIYALNLGAWQSWAPICDPREATLNQLQSSGVSKHDKKTMGTLLGQLKKQKAALHAEINHANSVALAADTVTVGKPAGGGSWGSSMKNDNGVIKHLSNCKQAAINVKFEFGLVNGQVEVKTTSIASAYPMLRLSQVDMRGPVLMAYPTQG